MNGRRKKKIHLAQFLVHGPTYHSLAMWRHPLTDHVSYDWTRPELYQAANGQPKLPTCCYGPRHRWLEPP